MLSGRTREDEIIFHDWFTHLEHIHTRVENTHSQTFLKKRLSEPVRFGLSSTPDSAVLLTTIDEDPLPEGWADIITLFAPWTYWIGMYCWPFSPLIAGIKFVSKRDKVLKETNRKEIILFPRPTFDENHAQHLLVIWMPPTPTLLWSNDCPGLISSPSNSRFLGREVTGEWNLSTAETDDTGELDPFSPAPDKRFTIGFAACVCPASPSCVSWLGKETSSHEGTGRPDDEILSHNGLSECQAMASKICSSIWEKFNKVVLVTTKICLETRMY